MSYHELQAQMSLISSGGGGGLDQLASHAGFDYFSLLLSDHTSFDSKQQQQHESDASENGYMEQHSNSIVNTSDGSGGNGLSLMSSKSLNELALEEVLDMSDLLFGDGMGSNISGEPVVNEDICLKDEHRQLEQLLYSIQYSADLNNGNDQINSPSSELTYANVNQIFSNEMTASPSSSSDSSDMNDESSLSDNCSTSTAASKKRASTKSASAPTVLRSINKKKESNKQAAIRYRNKKVLEKDALFIECDLYEQKNIELRRQVDEAQTEINCIKNLLVEALLAKNK